MLTSCCVFSVSNRIGRIDKVSIVLERRIANNWFVYTLFHLNFLCDKLHSNQIPWEFIRINALGAFASKTIEIQLRKIYLYQVTEEMRFEILTRIGWALNLYGYFFAKDISFKNQYFMRIPSFNLKWIWCMLRQAKMMNVNWKKSNGCTTLKSS